MSTAPQREVMARAACRAILTPPAAATREAAVEMLKVLKLSMPVPLLSSSGPSRVTWQVSSS